MRSLASMLFSPPRPGPGGMSLHMTMQAMLLMCGVCAGYALTIGISLLKQGGLLTGTLFLPMPTSAAMVVLSAIALWRRTAFPIGIEVPLAMAVARSL